jgi:hypothetical protein
VFAGAGVRPGAVHGRSDRIAAYVADNPVSTQDLLATVYHLCGIGPGAAIRDRLGRPHQLYGDGAPIQAILA